MICALCSGAIEDGEEINLHHPTPRSEGGIETKPTHKDCHIKHHSTNGDFKVWGAQGGAITAATKRWSMNLKNVRTHPAYEFARSFYAAHYAH